MSAEMLRSRLDKLAEEAAQVLDALKALRPDTDWQANFVRMVHHAYMRRRLNGD